MKNNKFLVRVGCSNRNFYLLQPAQGAEYHVKFTVPIRLRESPTAPRGGVVFRTTGTKELAPAKRIAAEIIESFFRQGDDGRSAEALKLRSSYAKLGEIVAAYSKGACTIADKEEIKRRTITSNIVSMRTLSIRRTAADGSTARMANEQFEELPVAVLTAELVQRFKAESLAPYKFDPVSLESKRRSVNSTLRQARSMFAPAYLPLYRDLRLPDLTGFMAAKGCKVDRQATRYVPIAQSVIDAMEREIVALRESRPEMFLAFYFMLWLGMRPSEVREARLEWIEEYPEQARMAIVRRPYFRPKGIDGVVSIAPRLLADVKALSGARAPSDYLIPAATVTERANMLRYDLSLFVRRHLGAERQKTCHELRKHAISMVLMRTRNYVDTLKFSRHADVKTLQQHYGSFLDELPAITSSNWRDAA